MPSTSRPYTQYLAISEIDRQDLYEMEPPRKRSRLSIALEPVELIPESEVDWVWPAIDTFTDATIGRHVLQTCSELGSQRIRLVRIRPGPPGSIIRLDVKTCDLAHPGIYTALSYTWGSSLLQYKVLADGQPRHITTNLWRFLSQARKLQAHFSGWLWIDALCIDQSDTWEKLEQVKIISSIFRCAKQTVVWLGPAYGDSDRVIKALVKLPPASSYSRSLHAMYRPHLWSAIIGICEREYWRRLWVFQELRASQTIHLMCGGHYFDFNVLKTFLSTNSAEELIRNKIRLFQQTLAAKMIKLTIQTLDTSLEPMLKATNHLHCADARDKMYAILGAVGPECKGIEAEYTITLTELFNRILRKMHECKEPDSLEEVSKQCNTLETLFAVESGSIYGRTLLQNYGRSGLFFFGSLDSIDRNSDMGHISWRMLRDKIVFLHTWCKHYGHLSILRLLYKDLIGSFVMKAAWKTKKGQDRDFDKVFEDLGISSQTFDITIDPTINIYNTPFHKLIDDREI